MPRHDPLLPNAAVIARREYLDRIRGPIYRISTVVLMVVAVIVALAPTAIGYANRQVVSQLAVVSSDPALAAQSEVLEALLNTASSSSGSGYEILVSGELDAALERVQRGELLAVLSVERSTSGGIEMTVITSNQADAARLQLFQVAAFGLGVLDWNARRPASDVEPFIQPTFETRSLTAATEGGRTLGPAETASRAFLGIVFVVLLFMTVVIYGMWVATGVAAEKSSRVMELMISAASPRQLLTGKVVGIGAAGLTQYVAIAGPALLVLTFQDRIAAALIGPDWASGAPVTGLTPGLLAAYAVFFLLAFSLFSLLYAGMASFVSRPDDLQTLSLPLSLPAVLGYVLAVSTLTGGGGRLITIASLVPPFSPFVMLARVMVSAVPPWQIVLSIAILLVTIAAVAVAASRMYAAGVLLYGQRPGLRAFIAAARRAG